MRATQKWQSWRISGMFAATTTATAPLIVVLMASASPIAANKEILWSLVDACVWAASIMSKGSGS